MTYPDYAEHVHHLRARFGEVHPDIARTVSSTDRGVVVVQDVRLLSDGQTWVQVAAFYGDDDRLFRVVVVKNDAPVETIFDYEQAGTIRS